MRKGGMYDQVGFGFHRYSTDAHWLVPHFEKMLYDQAILVQAYLDAFQATGKQYYADIVDEIVVEKLIRNNKEVNVYFHKNVKRDKKDPTLLLIPRKNFDTSFNILEWKKKGIAYLDSDNNEIIMFPRKKSQYEKFMNGDVIIHETDTDYSFKLPEFFSSFLKLPCINPTFFEKIFSRYLYFFTAAE